MFYSNFKPWSIGYVAENKERDSFNAKITPIELLPDLQDELTTDTRSRKVMGVNHVGELYSVEITEQPYLEAEWLGASYHEKAPDIAKGERVMLYKTGDGKKWYWDVFGIDEDHRKQEDVIISFSAKPDYDSPEPVAKDETNSYRLRINTYDKFIELSTSEANGEVTTYNTRWDMAEGYWKHYDKQGNHIFLDSINTIIELKDKDNSYVKIDKKEIFLRSDDLIQMDTDTIRFNCETFELNSTTSTINATDSFTLESANATMNAQTAALNFGTCTVGDGAWTVNAAFTFTKPVAVNGGLTVGAGAPAVVAGKISFSIPLKGYSGYSINGN